MTEYSYTGEIEYDTIALSGIYAITAAGAQGGASDYGEAGGAGAAFAGDLYLTAGTVLEIIVGGEGGAASGVGSVRHGEHTGGAGGGGGGGSFVFESLSSGMLDPLIVGGGGGGGGTRGTGGAGLSQSDGGSGSGVDPGLGGVAGAAGGGSTFSGGGGGGGYTGGAGQTGDSGGASGAISGTSFSGGMGGSGNAAGIFGVGGDAITGGAGGFGGGGGGGVGEDGGGGGGGGYGGGGGGGGSDGGGGGSYGGAEGAGYLGSNTGNGEVIITEALCYLRGTHILTPTGEVAVEAMRIGDAVVTRFGSIQRIKWIGRQSFAAETAAQWPVCIKAGALEDGVPARDLYVSPGHSMLLEGQLVLASRLVNGVTIRQGPVPGRLIAYYNLDLGGHDCVIAEGTWAETYADAPGMRAQFHNALEFEALYPAARPAAELALCAPRPEAGERLNAALLPAAARAAACVRPGPLEGYVERVEDGWRVIGWAYDPTQPALPVVLEVCGGSQVLGSVLACEYRADLAAAGKGSGHCAFTFTAPARLTAAALAELSVRRAVDAAALPLAAEMAGQRRVA